MIGVIATITKKKFPNDSSDRSDRRDHMETSLNLSITPAFLEKLRELKQTRRRQQRPPQKFCVEREQTRKNFRFSP